MGDKVVLFSYICSHHDKDLCVSLPTGGYVAHDPLPAVVKSAARNQQKPSEIPGWAADITKMRWNLVMNQSIIQYSVNPPLCLRASPVTRVVSVGACDANAVWVVDLEQPSVVVHARSKKCLGIMTCRERPGVVGTFCDPDPWVPRLAKPPFALGSTLAIRYCDFRNPAMRFVTYQDCSLGCSPFMLGDAQCDSLCNNEACQWDRGDCLGGSASTSPTGAPTALPSGAPTALFTTPPTALPTFAPFVPTGAPVSTDSPTRVRGLPFETPTTPAPADAPNPTTTPSLSPTYLYNDTNTTNSTNASAYMFKDNSWWAIVLAFALVGGTGTVYAMVALRKKMRGESVS